MRKRKRSTPLSPIDELHLQAVVSYNMRVNKGVQDNDSKDQMELQAAVNSLLANGVAYIFNEEVVKQFHKSKFCIHKINLGWMVHI